MEVSVPHPAGRLLKSAGVEEAVIISGAELGYIMSRGASDPTIRGYAAVLESIYISREGFDYTVARDKDTLAKYRVGEEVVEDGLVWLTGCGLLERTPAGTTYKYAITKEKDAVSVIVPPDTARYILPFLRDEVSRFISVKEGKKITVNPFLFTVGYLTLTRREPEILDFLRVAAPLIFEISFFLDPEEIHLLRKLGEEREAEVCALCMRNERLPSKELEVAHVLRGSELVRDSYRSSLAIRLLRSEYCLDESVKKRDSVAVRMMKPSQKRALRSITPKFRLVNVTNFGGELLRVALPSIALIERNRVCGLSVLYLHEVSEMHGDVKHLKSAINKLYRLSEIYSGIEEVKRLLFDQIFPYCELNEGSE